MFSFQNTFIAIFTTSTPLISVLTIRVDADQLHRSNTLSIPIELFQIYGSKCYERVKKTVHLIQIRNELNNKIG